MKKILSFLLSALLAFSVGWAAEVTFEIDNSGGGLLAQITSSNQTVSSNGVTLTFSKGTSQNIPQYNSGQIRFYANNTLTVSCSTGDVTSVVFTYGSGYTNTQVSLVSGQSGVYNTGDYTWTGSTPSVQFINANSGQTRFYKIVVTTGASSGGGDEDTNMYKKVASLGDLDAGKKYIIMYENGSGSVGMGALSNGHGSGISGLTVNNNEVNIHGKNVLEMTLGGSENAWTLATNASGDGSYLTWSSSTNLAVNGDPTNETSGAKARWIIESPDGGTSYIVKNSSDQNRSIRYNSSGNDFRPYSGTSTGLLAVLYVQKEEESNDPELSVTENSLSLADIPYNGSSTSGAFILTGAHLSQNVTMAFSGAEGFSINPSSTIIAPEDNGSVYQEYTVTYSGNSTTYVTATVTFTCDGLTETVIVTAKKATPPPASLNANPTTLTINDSGTNNTFTVTGSYLGSDNVGLTQSGTNFTPTLTATTGNPYEGVYNDSPYWGFTPADGSLNGTVAVNYTGRQLSASNTVTLANNVANATVDVNYLADLYIVTDNGVTNDWHFDGTYGEHMTYSDGIYTATFTAENPTTFILFARKLGENDPWGTRYVFGPSSGGDWWLPASGNGNGTIDLNTSHPIRIQDAGTYIVTINANDNTFTITKEVVNEGDFVLVTDDSQLAAGNEVIIVNKGVAGAARTMGQRNANNYYGTGVTVSNTKKVTPTNDTQIFTLEQGSGGWYFKTSDDKYLSSYTTTSNYLQTTAKDENGTGTSLAVISIGSNNAASIVFQGDGSRKTLQYNPNGITSDPTKNDIFSCYSGNQQDVFIYQRTASAEPSISVNPSTIDIVIPAGETSEDGTATVTESNTTGTTSVSVTGEDASNFTASLNDGTLTVTYNGTANASDPDVATITLTNGNATAAVEVTGYKLPVVLTITPADGHTFQGSTVNGMIESNVDGATIEYSFDGTNWMTYDSDEGITATVSEVGGTVTVYARTTVNGETATAQATYTRIPKTATCTADIVFDPTSNNGEMSQWNTLKTHISEGSDYVSSATMSKIFTSNDYDAIRFGTNDIAGELNLTLDLTKFETGACKLNRVIIHAARYSNDTGCQLNVSTDVDPQGITLDVTAGQNNFADYTFSFTDHSEISSLTIANLGAGKRVYVHSITIEYNCGTVVATPVIDPATGLYYSDQTVTITDATENAVIYYTTDGTDPTTSSAQYTSSFVVPYVAGGSTTVKAIAVITEDGEQLLSGIASETYTWGLPSENSLSVIERDLETSNTVPVAVSDRLIGVWAAKNILWAKDQNNASIDATYKRDDQLDYVRMAKLKTTEHAFQEDEWDQSNWVMLDFSNIDANPFDYVGYEFDNNSVIGYYVDDLNYRIELMQAPTKAQAMDGYPGFNQDPIDENDDHTLNHYVSSNFYEPNLNWGEYDGYWFEDEYLGHSIDTCLFFMNPKIQEIAQVWAVWNADLREFTIYQREGYTVNAYNLDGAFTLTDDQWQYNHRETISGLSEEQTYGSVEDQLIDDAYYIFHVAIMRSDFNYGHRKSSSQPSGMRDSEAIDSQATSGSIVVYPLDLSADDAHNPPTAVREIVDVTAKDVVSVRYYNLMGIENEKPFEGINIVVTRYADGSISSSKIMR